MLSNDILQTASEVHLGKKLEDNGTHYLTSIISLKSSKQYYVQFILNDTNERKIQETSVQHTEVIGTIGMFVFAIY